MGAWLRVKQLMTRLGGAVLLAAAVALIGCVRVEAYNNPTLVPGWQLYSSVEVGYALALPTGWAAFDLDTEVALAVGTCSVEGKLRDARREQINGLHQRGVRLYLCDSGRVADADFATAYATPRSTRRRRAWTSTSTELGKAQAGKWWNAATSTRTLATWWFSAFASGSRFRTARCRIRCSTSSSLCDSTSFTFSLLRSLQPYKRHMRRTRT